jgi:phospholipid/cholesterol/gamma-HCH transport system substrate-binding protein
MKLSIEARVGIIGVATLAVLIWGINYLKGKNILSKSYTAYALYQDAGGVGEAAPVMLHGVKIGYVDRIMLHPDEKPPVTLLLRIRKAYHLPRGSVAELYSSDIMGTKAIRLRPSGSSTALHPGDTLKTGVVPDMLTGLQDWFAPVMEQIGTLAGTLDSLGHSLDSVIGSESIVKTMDHLASISGSLSRSLEEGGSLEMTFSNLESFSSMLSAREDEVSTLIGHLNSVSESADSAGISQLTGTMTSAALQLEQLLQQINSGTGNAGRLVYSDTLLANLETLISDLDKLARDLQEHPEDYVQVSLFGRSKKGKK